MVYVCPWCDALLGRDKAEALSHEAECEVGPDLDMGFGPEEES